MQLSSSLTAPTDRPLPREAASSLRSALEAFCDWFSQSGRPTSMMRRLSAISRSRNQRCLVLLLCLLLLLAVALISMSQLKNARLTRRTSDMRAIPRILHQVSQSEMVFADYSIAIESCKRLNPNWTHILWRDTDAELLIKEHFPKFYHTHYKKYTDKLQKSDSIRYIILYLFGGVYADLDVECLQPFFPNLEEESCFLDQENRIQTQVLWDREKAAMNSVMGCRPGHPFMLDLIDRMYKEASESEVMLSTGPMMLTAALDEWTIQDRQLDWADSVRLMDSDVFSPHVDNIEIIMETCRKRFGRPSKRASWVDRACQHIQVHGLNDNFTDRSMAVHWFMHIGWLSKRKRERLERVNITRLVPKVRFYRQHRAQLSLLMKPRLVHAMRWRSHLP